MQSPPRSNKPPIRWAVVLRNLDGIRNIDILATTVPEGIKAQVAELADALG
jgi:hypothetical protein